MDPPTFGQTAERTIRPSTDYYDSDGYDPDFIPGYEVPLPSHRDMSRIAARTAQALSGANIYELQYHHFSIVMHRMQRLALFAACNIDGRKPKKVDRDIGAVSAS